MTFGQLILILRARWVVALTVLLCVVVFTLGISLLPRKQYTATASVVVDVKSPDPIAGVVLTGMMSSSYMSTQVNVFQSERVALRALRSLGLHQDAKRRSSWMKETGGAGDFESWLSDWVLRTLEVRPARDSNVMTVSYTSPDPKFSADVANAFVKSYVETTLELRVEPARQYNNFFDGRARQAREALSHAQGTLLAYQRSRGMIASDEKLDVENARLAELSSQLVALQAIAFESSGRQSQAAGDARQLSEVLNSPVVTTLTSELSRQEARLNEIKMRLGDRHPQVQELRANIVQMRAGIEMESRRVTGSLRVNNSVNESRLAQLRGALDEQRAKLLRLKGQRDEAAVLQVDVQNAQRAYDAVLSRANQSSLESGNTQTNVSVLKHATPPPSASSQQLPRNMAIAVVLGCLLGVGVALLREALDRRLRSEEDVAVGLGQPLLVVLPRAEHPSAGESPRLRSMKARVVNSLPRFAQ